MHCEVHWPNEPVEQIPARSFVPPHCPSPSCPTHAEPDRTFRFARGSSYSRKCDQRVVPRFRCMICGKHFSQQTFTFSYYRKRPELELPVAAGLLAGSAHRQLARSLKCAPSTVTRLAARLGRHSLLLLALGLDQLDGINEPVVYDDFETFFLSQDLPCGLSTPVGQETSFVYGLDCAPHRRSGRRRPARKRRHHPDPQPESGGYERAFRRTLDLLLASHRGPGRLKVITDKHPGYRAGLRAHPQRHRIRHLVYANPKKWPSEEATRRNQAMFAADVLHMLIRHSLAHHRRETIAFCRRLNALLERGFLMAVWRNWIKGRSERKNDTTTPAMQVGLAREPWDWSRVLVKRLFPWRLRVPAHWMTIYRRGLITPEIGPNTRHTLIRAF